jgi:UDPglucose--hexose-1-phosphate uridylyltransferase
MSDLRYDPVSDHWVTIARNRLDRPQEFIPLEQVRQQLICPFCRGNEDQTPAGIAAYLNDGRPLDDSHDPASWVVRVIPNKFPSYAEIAHGQTVAGPFGSSSDNGQQLLIIPTHRHLTSISELNEEELHVSLMACQQQISSMKSDAAIRHAMLFMNCRSSAGASLGHIHYQLIGSPVVSGYLAGRVQRNLQSVQRHGQTLMKRILDWEISQKVRIVKLTENYCIVCPFASRFPFQVWIVPMDPQGGFAGCSPAKRNELSQLCRSMVEQLETLLDQTAYNLLLHHAPFHDSDYDHWYIELFPRLTTSAGFEWGTDIWVNPVSPEAAARRLQ